MLDLSRKLTDELVIGDKVYSLNMSFDNIIRLFEMWCDEEIPEQVKPFFALKMLTGEGFGSFSIEDAMDIFQQVFEEHIQLKSLKDVSVEYDLAGNVMKKEPSAQSKEPPVYDISLDGDYIYASFMQAYGIDLLEERGNLHWKKFNALLSGLPEGTKIVEVIKIRKYKPRKGDSQAYIDEMMKLKKEYALPDYEEYDDEDELTKYFINNLPSMLKNENIAGVTDVIEFFNERKDIRELFEKLIEQKAKENSKSNVNVILGDELGIKELEDFSFVYSIYDIGGAQGIIGVMGPKRMAYSKTMGLINHVSREVNKLINSMEKDKNKRV